MTLRKRLVLAMWLPVLALGTSIAITLGVENSRLADLRADQAANLSLSLEEQRFRGFFAGRLALLKAWVRTSEVQSGDPARVTPFLALQEADFARLYEHLYFDALDGTVYPTRGEPFRINDRPYFPAIARGEEVVSGPWESRDTGKRILLFAVPVRSPSGELIGALAASVELESLFAGLNRGLAAESLSLSVVDRDLKPLLEPAPATSERLRGLSGQLPGEVTGVDLPGDGPSTRVWSRPLPQPGWTLVATRPESAIYEAARTYQFIIFGLLAATLLGTLFGARAVAKRWSSSLGVLSDALRRYGDGDTTVRVPQLQNDEVDELGHTFNEMAGRLETSETARTRLEAELTRSQRLESIGRVAGGVAHDYNNLLTIILSMSQVVSEELGPSHELAEDVKAIIDASTRSVGLTRQLLAIARQQDSQPRELAVDPSLAENRGLLERLLSPGVTLVWQPGAGDARVRVDPTHLLQIVMNLVINARDAMNGKGTVTLSTRVVPGSVELRVADTGPGVPKEVRDRLFEPFVTTKPAGRGTGLGLATCFGLVSQAGGRIELATDVSSGACFVVTLPRLDGA